MANLPQREFVKFAAQPCSGLEVNYFFRTLIAKGIPSFRVLFACVISFHHEA
jgi:hypothetical protein